MPRQIKNKKLIKIHNSKIKVDYKKLKNPERIKITININDIVEPAARPRTSSRLSTGLYDPLSSYKNYIKKNIDKLLHEKCPNFKPLEGSAIVESLITIRTPANFSDYQKIMAIRHWIKPLTKPDNDNYEKTIFDIFKNILWLDDSQVAFNSTEKRYGTENNTEIIVYLQEKREIESFTGRMPKELKDNLSREEIDFLNSYKHKDGE